MEQEITNSVTEQNPQLIINENGRQYLKTASKWATFLAIMGFIGTGFLILAGLFISVLSPLTSRINPSFGFPFWLLGLFYILFASLYFFPSLYLYNFASKAKTALFNLNQDEFDSSLKNLKKMFKFFGIMTIIILVVYIIAIPVFFIFSISNGMMH